MQSAGQAVALSVDMTDRWVVESEVALADTLAAAWADGWEAAAPADAQEEAGSTEGWEEVEQVVQHEGRKEEQLLVVVACRTLAVRTLQ